jgi:hypothetical protein
LKGNKETCGKKAKYYMTRHTSGSKESQDDKYLGFCKTHLKQSVDYWSEFDTRNLFGEINSGENCTFMQRTGNVCGRKAKYSYHHHDTHSTYCTVHYKSELNKKIKEFGPQLISNTIVKKYPTTQLKLNLISSLDKLSTHFAMLGIEEVIIENQPSLKNPKMKSIANALFDYFLIRGTIDKYHDLDIDLVREMCPSNKLRINNDNTMEVFKKNPKAKSKYKLTKELGIQYTKQLLRDSPDMLEYLDMFKKQDDLCDAYLQGRYYLQFIRAKNGKKKQSKKSKTSKKSKKKSRTPVKTYSGSKTKKIRSTSKVKSTPKVKSTKIKSTSKVKSTTSPIISL